jgi:hypothetical protein
MSWMAWRQLRTSAVAAAALLAAASVLLLVTGLHINDLYTSYLRCGGGLTCGSALDELHRSVHHVDLVGVALIALPAIPGLFWGAPLVSRELESGTFRLAWTQGVSRNRWITTKLLVGAAAAVATAGVLAFAFTWWSIPFDRTGSSTRIDPNIFDQRAIVPIAYALFAFTLGAAAGALIRRTLAAMAVTLGGFIAVRLIVQIFVRPHLLAPVTRNWPLSFRNGIGLLRTPSGLQVVAGHPDVPGAWVTGSKLADATGHAPSSAVVTHTCSAALSIQPPAGSGPAAAKVQGRAMQALQTCVGHLASRYHEVVSYQPASHFWALQWIESAIFGGAALALAGLTVYWVRRRLV